MRYGSVCSGIEAASVAWESLGWKASFLSEIETFPRRVLAHHYPNTKLHGDFTTIKKDDYDPIELLVGGTPCQSFSVAGLRAGLDDPRGNLMLEFGSLARRLNPKWLVWENVPGVLSSNRGRDFGTFLGMLGELGYGFAYRVLDAQYFGVAQRRRRVFVVGYFGDWRSAAAVLFDSESLRGNNPPSREAGKEVAGTFMARAGKSGGWSNSVDHAAAGYMQPVIMSTGQAGAEIGIGVGTTLNCNHEAPIACYSLSGNTIGRKPENGGNGNGYDESGVSYTLTKTDQHAVAFSSKDNGRDAAVDHSQTLCNQHTGIAVESKFQVRRLTPTECEKLQGFPIGYTNIPGASDTGRYKALGNSMAVPVMKWIGERIQAVENINKMESTATIEVQA
jgi:DNA (cytosine-5)-methyltransferase 1